MKPELSIVIITLNEQENLPKLLESIKKQEYKNYEIIVSDAGSKDKTLEIAGKFRCRIVKGGLPSRGRNNGAKSAKGKYLLFLDADCLVPLGFLKNIMKQFKEESIDIATVSLIPLTKRKVDRIYHKAYNLWQKSMEKIDPHSPGSCIIIKKSLFENLEGFDETIKLAEDHALARKAFRRGAKYKILDEKVFVSVRRLKKEGTAKFAVKYILAAVHRITIGEIRHDLFRYDLKR